jgi:uncharacterized protein YigE (DUF2233 family)
MRLFYQTQLALPIAALATILVALTQCAPAQNASSAPSTCSTSTFEGDQFTVCRFDPAHQTMALVLSDNYGVPLRSFAKLAEKLGSDAARVSFAMNAGMFNDAGEPIGLYVEGGKQRHVLNRRDGPGNFHMKPNGVFWIDATGPHVSTTDDYAALTNLKPVYATQSGPMLVARGTFNPQFSPDGASRNIRNGVGISSNGTAVFVISAVPVSFGKFARMFRDALKCPDALYFDGAISSLWDPAADWTDSSFALGPMVVVMQNARR